MFVLRMKDTGFYLARKGCTVNETRARQFGLITMDLEKALPLGNINTAKARAIQWLKDQKFSCNLYKDQLIPFTIEIVHAKIVADDVEMIIE